MQDPRFRIEESIRDGVPMLRWAHGPQTVGDVVALYRQHDDRDFMVHGPQRSTYRGVVEASHIVALALLAAGLAPGERVAILMRNRIEWPVWFIGAIQAGGIAVPVNGWAAPAELVAALEDCGARLLVTDRSDLVLPAAVAHIWSIGLEITAIGNVPVARSEDLLGLPEDWDRLAAGAGDLPAQAPDEVAAIFYTSGTTGQPKGATITHRALTAAIKNDEYAAERTRLRFPPEPGAPAATPGQPVALFPVPFFHVTGAIAGLIRSSATGVKIVLMHKWDIMEALELIERERVTMIGGVPTIPLQLLADPRRADYDLSSLVGLSYGGAPAPSHLPAAIADSLHAEASTGWGMTETAATLLYQGGPEYRLHPASCGVAAPVNAVRIAGGDGRPAATGDTGELQVRGLNVTRGYWNRPDATAQAFTADGWLRTGDIARLDEEGFVTIVDRAKDVIIRGGENIACIEIEDVLCGHRDVVEAAVVGRPHPLLGEEPVAFVTLAPGAAIAPAALAEYAAAHLIRHKRPAAILASREPLSRNPAGKVLKNLLRDRLAQANRDGDRHD